MDCWKLLLVGGVFLLAMPSARAGDVEAQNRKAKKACLLGNTKEGIEILTELYLDTNNPSHLFNQGRCFEQAGQAAQAILRFEEFLRKAKHLPASEAAAVRKRIDGLQAKVTKAPQAAPEPTTAPPPEPAHTMVNVSAIPPVAAPAPQPVAITETNPTAEPQPPAYKRWWFWTGIGALVAGGVVTAILLSSQSAAQSPACHQGGQCVP